MPFRVGHLIIVVAWLLSIVALTLIFISYLSPFPERHRALITIIPNMTAEQYLASENETIDAPSITIGFFVVLFPTAPAQWGGVTLSTSYQTAHLGVYLDAPTMPLGWLVVFFLPFPENMNKYLKLFFETLFEYMPLLSFFFGLVGFVATHTLFSKTCTDFNNYQIHNPTNSNTFVASPGNGFLLAWLAYGFVFHAMTVLWVAFFKEPKPAPKATPAASAPAPAAAAAAAAPTPATAAPAPAMPATAAKA